MLPGIAPPVAACSQATMPGNVRRHPGRGSHRCRAAPSVKTPPCLRQVSASGVPGTSIARANIGRAQGADVKGVDTGHGQLRDVGDDLRREAACGGAAAHRQSRYGNSRLAQQPEMPRQFASQAFHHRAEQVTGPVVERNAQNPAACREGFVAVGGGRKQRPETQPVAAGRDLGQPLRPHVSAAALPRPIKVRTHWIAEPPLRIDKSWP